MRTGVMVEQVLAPVPGGTGRYARELLVALRATSEDDDQVSAWAAWHRDTGGVRSPGGPPVRRLPLPRRMLVAAWARGWPHPVPTDVDLVHAPTLLAPTGIRVPLVVTVHDAVPWTHPETLTARGVSWHRRMAELVAARADVVVVPTRAVADALVQHVAVGRLEVVGEGVSSDLVEPPDAEHRAARLGLPRGGFMLSLATLEPRKGLDVLLEALAQPGAPALPLLVVGQPGWGDVDLPRMVERLGLADNRVRVLGRVPDADLAVLLRRATVLVAPSRAEGFGLPVLEAMHAGTPVVCSDDPALAEVGGEAVVTSTVGDPISLASGLAQVVEDETLRSTMVGRGVSRAAEYTWDGAATRLWSIYRALIDER